jgi:copper homeostasis protein
LNKIIFEACVDSIDSAILAEKAGADRIELCSDLDSGGLTPSYGLIRIVLERLSIPVNVLIRPRVGDFNYSTEEFEVMKQDTLFCRDSNVNGIVIGILNSDGTVDKERTFELIDIARPMSITFNRAFDFTRDPFEALDTLIVLGADRILTSGLDNNALAGIEMIKKLVDQAKNKIIIMPGGGVNENNAAKILKNSGAKEIHASVREVIQSKMNYKNSNISLCSTTGKEEFGHKILSPVKVRNIIDSIR